MSHRIVLLRARRAAPLSLALGLGIALGCSEDTALGPPPAHDHAAAGHVVPPPDDAGSGSTAAPEDHAAAGHAAASDDDAISHWTCPMHPSVHEAHPGACPICGMQLVPVTKREARSAEIRIDDGARVQAGIRLVAAESGRLQLAVRAPGRVVPDESGLADVTARVAGFVGRVHVRAMGESVREGDVVATLFAPELVAAQSELQQSAREGARGTGLAAAARARLQRLGVADVDVRAIERAGAPLEQVPVRAPTAGFVTSRDVVDGAPVEPGTRLLRIAPSRRLWVEAEVFEPELALVAAGATAHVRLPGAEEAPLDGRVSFVSPVISPESRTGRVRIELANDAGRLRSEGWAEVRIDVARGEHVLVPVAAVLYTGERRIVFVEPAPGRLAPRDVTIGASDGERTEITSGLAPGERVVASGVFLVAAESRLRAATARW